MVGLAILQRRRPWSALAPVTGLKCSCLPLPVSLTALETWELNRLYQVLPCLPGLSVPDLSRKSWIPMEDATAALHELKRLGFACCNRHGWFKSPAREPLKKP